MTALCVRFYQQAAFQRQKEVCSCRSGAFSSSILELRVKYLRVRPHDGKIMLECCSGSAFCLFKFEVDLMFGRY